jgi:hypothetical protein
VNEERHPVQRPSDDIGELDSPLKNTLVAFFNLAKCRAELRTARKITTCFVILASHPCDDAAY